MEISALIYMVYVPLVVHEMILGVHNEHYLF